MKTRFYMVFLRLDKSNWTPLQYFDGGSAKAWPTHELAVRQGEKLTHQEWKVREFVEIEDGTAETLEVEMT